MDPRRRGLTVQFVHGIMHLWIEDIYSRELMMNPKKYMLFLLKRLGDRVNNVFTILKKEIEEESTILNP